MTTLSIVLGILTWCLISVLIGLVGSRRKIGFAWTFVLSLILTPIVGLIAALTSPKLPHGGEKWGFVHIGFMVLTALALISFLVVLFTGGIFFCLLYTSPSPRDA